ncbi:TetR/AcrR family transcriptional regulator [Micromonospora sp. NBC_01813]|uniref:TetR/AcrR family transcriptional regulator n=1 Tax=Micromonospora sp. NBC_01813 TaxID=2975988 RepID=UPI002DDB916B|nr:TetR family transcriptional regulator [Micromonospora sp. NBC_01813]WSA10527.1 TetR/AcrR family transcriptional regulator [Micromonospora sp. NBC_01813]
MAVTAVRAADSQQRFIDAAIRLFARHGFAGTSLQMIADEVGVTKSAVHHHFRTREELLNAVVEPLLGEVRVAVEAAEGPRGRRARAERMLTGVVDFAVRNRMLVPVLVGDPGATEMLRSRTEVGELVNRMIMLLADIDPGVGGWIKADMVMAGIAGGMSDRARGLDDDVLRRHLIEASRRTLGLRAPRRLR